MTMTAHPPPMPLLAALPDWVGLVLLWVMIALEVALCGGAALIWALVGRQPLREAFSWRRPAPAALAGAVLLAAGLIPWVSALEIAQCALFPSLAASDRAQTEMFVPLMLGHPLLLVLGLALSAAVPEEMLFRGPIQRALLRRLPVWPALGLGGLIFALAHLDVSGLVARTALGVLLGWVVLRTRSLLPAVALHFAYDAGLLGLGVWQVHSLGAARVLAMAAHPAAGATVMDWLVWPAAGALLIGAGLRLCRGAGNAVPGVIAPAVGPACGETEPQRPSPVAEGPSPATE